MLIDWFTVFAQAVNFVVLVWLLKRFLYKPILLAVDKREQRIAAELQSAEAKEAKALQEMEEYRRKNEELEQKRDALLREAANQAAGERQKLMEQARSDCDTFKTRLQQGLEADHETLKKELAARTQEEVFAITRKTLADLASESLDTRIAEVFTAKLRELDMAKKEELVTALKDSQGAAVVRSAFELGAPVRSALEQAITDAIGAVSNLQFETVPRLVAGIELLTNSHKLAWTIDEYLTGMETSVHEVLDNKDIPNEQAR